MGKVMHMGFEIEYNDRGRERIEQDFFRAGTGLMGAQEVARLQDNWAYWGHRLLRNAEKQSDPKKQAWQSYWGTRMVELSDRMANYLEKQDDYQPD